MNSIIKSIIYGCIPPKLLFNKGFDTNKIYLSFDDGPEPIKTAKIFNVLCKYGISATFFFNGEHLQSNRTLVKEIFDAGNLIGNHSYFHEHLRNFDILGPGRTIRRTKLLIEDIIGCACQIYRPPYGKITIPLLCDCFLHNITIVMWSFDSKDSFIQDAVSLLERLKHVKAGDILLFHSETDITVENIEEILKILKDRNFIFGNITELLLK